MSKWRNCVGSVDGYDGGMCVIIVANDYVNGNHCGVMAVIF